MAAHTVRYKVLKNNTPDYWKLVESLKSLGYSFSRTAKAGDGVYGLVVNIRHKTVTACMYRQTFHEAPGSHKPINAFRKLLYQAARVLPEEDYRQLDLPVDDLKEKPTIIKQPEIVPDLFLILQGEHQWFKTTKQAALAFATNKATQYPQNPIKICEVHVVGTVTSEIKIDFNTSS